jgi:hypothetical protein
MRRDAGFGTVPVVNDAGSLLGRVLAVGLRQRGDRGRQRLAGAARAPECRRRWRRRQQ